MTSAGRRGVKVLKMFLKTKRKEWTVFPVDGKMHVSYSSRKRHGCDLTQSHPRQWTAEDPSLGVTVQQSRALKGPRKLKLKALVNCEDGRLKGQSPPGSGRTELH